MTRTRNRACVGKRAHASKADALQHVFSRRRSGATRSATQAYRCAYCRMWHVGHSPRSRKRQRH